MSKQANITSQLTCSEQINVLNLLSLKNSHKRWCTPSFRPSEKHKTKSLPLTLRLFLDPFPDSPVSSVVPFVSANSTNEETCNLLVGFLTRWLVDLTICPWVRMGSSRASGLLSASQQPSGDSPPSYGHTSDTSSSCQRTSLAC